MAIDETLAELTSRLPELEWKINGLHPRLSGYNIPRGLFNVSAELSAAACIDEIKADINFLAEQKNERSAHYLAKRINLKINVLVTLCQINDRKTKPEEKEKISFGLNMLSTRQQWIATLEKDIHTLEKQQQAMTRSLSQMNHFKDNSSILSLQKELGEVVRRLTLAREALHNVVAKVF